MSNPKNPDPDKSKPPAKKAAAPATKGAPAKKPAAAKPAAQPSGGGYLNFAQIEAVAMHAGASPQEAVTLAAIAMAESSGYSHNLNNNAGTGDLSYGLWQINMLGRMGQDRQQQWGLHSYNDLYDPLTNARAALSLLRGNHGFGDWTTYTSGAYQQFLPDAQAALPHAAKVNVNALQTAGAPAAQAAGTGATSDVRKYLDNNPDVAAQYGYLSAYLNDPTIGPILKQAAAEGRGSNWLLGQLEKTSWWKTTAQTAREMQALQRTDPATYRQKYQGMLAQVSTLATSLGIQIPKNRLGQLATTALWSGWSNLQIQNAVGAEFHYNPTAAYKGSAGADVQRFKQLAAQYLTPLSNGTLGTWVQQALQGKVNPDDFTGYLAEQAKTLFPWMSKAIDSGVAPTTYLDSYKQAAAQTLELDPNAVNFMDPKWRSLFETVDPKTHERTERGLANALTMMRTDPRYGYDQTQGAKQEGAGLAANLAQMFGFTGTGSSIGAGVNQPTAA